MLLLKFGITGVQEFVTTARKVRDSACGSALLTESMRHAASTLSGVTMLVPADPSACAHQLLVEIDGDESRAREVGTTLVEAFMSRLEALSVATSPNTNGAWHNELMSAFTPMWVAVTVDTNDSDAAFERVQSYYEERKLTRRFAPAAGNGASRGGCQVCARRDAAMRARGRDEWLCLPCFVKRHVVPQTIGSPARIPSTREFASARYLDSAEGKSLVKAAQEDLEAGFMDTTGESVSPRKAEDTLLDDDDLPTDLHSDMAESVEARRKELRRRSEGYYAICAFDGDEMGRWFSAAAQYRCSGDGPREHLRRVGEAVRRFRSNMDSIALPQRALRAYVGGDDGLLFLPLDGTLASVEAIRAHFVAAMSDLARGGPTLSLSLVFVDESFPLQSALEVARRTLAEFAKDDLGRNALAVTAIFGGGAVTTGGAGWADWQPGLVSWLRTAAKISRPLAPLSRRFWYELIEQAPPCFLTPDETGGGPLRLRPRIGEDMLSLLSGRLWLQHGGGESDARTEILSGLIALSRLPHPRLDVLKNVQALLKIADFLARKEVV